MAIQIIGGTSGVVADTDTDKSIKIVNRPPAFGALGAYAMGTTTGLIVATGSANAVIWTCRWTDATRFALIEKVQVNAVVSATITAAVPYNLSLIFGTSYTVSPTTSITAATLTGRNAKRRTSHGTTLMGGIWTLTTAAAGITGQTVTQDTQALGTISGGSGTVIGTQFFGSAPGLLYGGRDSADYPLILAQNEGLVITAPLAGPATGTFQVSVSMSWMEVAAY